MLRQKQFIHKVWLRISCNCFIVDFLILRISNISVSLPLVSFIWPFIIIIIIIIIIISSSSSSSSSSSTSSSSSSSSSSSISLSATSDFKLNKVSGNIHCPFSLRAFICLGMSQVSNLFIYYIFVLSNSVLVLLSTWRLKSIQIAHKTVFVLYREQVLSQP